MGSSNSFLETGALIGYCLLLDQHHLKCQKYINGNTHDYYTSKEVKDEYDNTKTGVKNRLSSAVLDHVGDLKNDSCQGYLGPMDVNNIKKNVLHHRNDAYQFLYRYYSGVVNNGVQKGDLEDQLRDLARDIDRIVIARENQLLPALTVWSQQGSHPSIESALSMIHNPDRSFAIQAHDLAHNKGGHTEFATANPTDFVYNGRKKTVLNNTDLDDIVDLSI